MRFRSLGVLLALVVALVLLSGCLSNEPRPRAVHTDFEYELRILTTTLIENVTLLIPIPMRDEHPIIGSVYISDEFYMRFGGWRYPLPEHYTFAIVPVDGQYYLQMTTPFMDPEKPVQVRYRNSTYLDEGFRPEYVLQMIDTRHPFGNESLFYPKQNLTLTGGSNPSYGYSYAIPVYAYYENGTRVEIVSEIEGINGWLEHFDSYIYNRYEDRYRLTITGESQGWMSAEGSMMTGEGVYREWQLAPNGTSGAG